MKTKLIHEQQGEEIFALVFDKGDEFTTSLLDFAKQHNITAAQFTAIGAFKDAMLGYFDREKKDYIKIPVDEQVEVLSLVGNIALSDGEPKVHAHVVLGKQDGTTRGGHLLEAHIWPTLEVIVTESPKHLHRTTDAETGLPLIDPAG